MADEQVLHEPGQVRQPWVLSKYWPALQVIGLRTSCWHTPQVSLQQPLGQLQVAICELQTVLRGQVAQPPLKTNWLDEQESVQIPQLLKIYPLVQTHLPLEMTWLLPQVQQLPWLSSSSSDLHWLIQVVPCRILPPGHEQPWLPLKIKDDGQTEQIPFMMKPFGKFEQIVQTLAEFSAYPALQTQMPPTNCSFSPQIEQLEPSDEALLPAGQTVQIPLTLPKPLKQAHCWLTES